MDSITKFELEYEKNLKQSASLKVEIQSLETQKTAQQTQVSDLAVKVLVQTEKLTEITRQHDEAKQSTDPLVNKVRELRAEAAKLEKERATAESQTKDIQQNLRQIMEKARLTSEEVNTTQADSESELTHLRAKLVEEKIKIDEEEKAHFENMKLETARKVADLEREMLADLHTKREKLAREMVLKIETFFREHPMATSSDLDPLEVQIRDMLSAQTAENKGQDSKSRMVTAMGLKRRQRLIAGFAGALLGAAATFVGLLKWQEYRNDTSPLQSMVNLAQEARVLDLQKRKYNPPQDAEVRATYMDSVIYTKDYATVYLNDAYQKELLRAVAPYMFKTWRLDEDKVIELLGMSAALVKNLDEKKNAIHPDFVAKGLEKMKTLESEETARMRDLLGTEVRLQSYRKFENNFFQEYQSRAH